MWVFTGVVKSSLSKIFSKFSRKHPWWSPVLSGISVLIVWNFTNTGLCQGYFLKFIQHLIKLHIVFCMYYILSGVSNLFLMVSIQLKRRFICCILYLKKPSKCVLKLPAHKPWDSFQKYFPVDANHLMC